MKVKRLPEDFQVEELPDVSGGTSGSFVFYRLTKSGMGTFEALEAIQRRWNLSSRQISYGGLKDRHAMTVQYITILNGPQRPQKEKSFSLEPLGRLPFAYTPAHFLGNRFTITLRDLSHDAVARAIQAIEELPRDGLPNYFDDQRFGSVGFNGGFIAHAWLQGNQEEALRLAIAEPTASDRPDTKGEKAILREHWGDWVACKSKLDRSHARSLVTYLVDHPVDFKGAFARLRRELRSIYFSAYQSHLWNLILGRLIEADTRPDQRTMVDFKVAKLPIHHGLEPGQAAKLTHAQVPLPASRTTVPEGPIGDLARQIVSEQGLVWEELRVKHLKDVFFSKGSRPAVFVAKDFEHSVAPDDLYPGKQKLKLSFVLPKGAYATLAIKRLTEFSTQPGLPAESADHGEE